MHTEISLALEAAARQRHKASAARKKQTESNFSPQSYHRLQKQLNQTSFLAPIDSNSTKVQVSYTLKKFMRFCSEKRHGHWKRAIHWRYCDKGLIMTFLFWICETFVQSRRKQTKKSTLNQYWRDLKMLYRRWNEGKVINGNDCEEIRKYINEELTTRFKLDSLPGAKPVLGVDDLLLGLTHLWARDRSVFPTEGDRLDLAIIMLFQAYTACRPAELVDGTKSLCKGDPMLDDSHIDEVDAQEHDSDAALEKDAPALRPRIEKEASGAYSSSDDSLASDDDTSSQDDADDKTDNTDYDDIDCVEANNHQNVLDDKVATRLCKDSCVNNGEEPNELARRHKALCYEDITLWIVQNPAKGERDVLAMEVLFHYHKGADRKPKPQVNSLSSLFARLWANILRRTVFLFRENPLPILCPISHFIARVIRDKAVEVAGYDKDASYFSTQIGRKAVKVQWKPSVMKTPVVRQLLRTDSGWAKSEEDAMKYSTYRFYLDRIGSDLGSEEKWTSYCFRRGNANALLGVAPNSIVDQVMRHDPLTGCMQNAYQNSRVSFNTQDVFLERDPSADGLTKAFTHISIRCNPDVPKRIPQAELAKLPPDPEVLRLDKDVKVIGHQLRREFQFIKSAPPSDQRKYCQLRLDLKSAHKRFMDDMSRVYQQAYRRRIYNDELQRQLSGAITGCDGKSDKLVQHQLSERGQLSTILCDFSPHLDEKTVTDRKVCAIDLLARLAGRCETPSRPAIPGLIKEDTPTPSEKPTPELKVPLMLEDTQCVFCLRIFKRRSHMIDHVQNVHIKRAPQTLPFECRHPECQPLGAFLKSWDHFKNHVQRVHGVRLRK